MTLALEYPWFTSGGADPRKPVLLESLGTLLLDSLVNCLIQGLRKGMVSSEHDLKMDTSQWSHELFH